MPENILVCTAWPYANGPLHLGSLAGCYLPADIFARYHRMNGNRVLMVSGSDVHGTPITLRAEEEGVSPGEVASKYHDSFLDTWTRFGISYDLFTSTGTDNHRSVTHDIFRRLYESGFIYPSSMKVAYSPDSQRYLPDRYVNGTCPYCSNQDARGDQCDECGRTLDSVELINPQYRVRGEVYPIEFVDTDHLFLKLSHFQDELLNWVRSNEHWRPNVRNFTHAFLEEGLRDRPITRDIEWGISVPVEGFEDKRIYVWFEAVIGYLSASKEWAANNGEPDAWEDFWVGGNSRAYYFLGKDNIPFHSMIWPAMLMGYGGLNLPYDIPANEFLTLEGRQFSTSRRWAVWAPDYLDSFPADPLRYHLAANMPETGDTDFSWAEYVRRNNDELVATFGNLVHRVLTMVQRNFEGEIPDPVELRENDKRLLERSADALGTVGTSLERCRFREGIQGFMALARDVNRYLDSEAPWKQVKNDPSAAAKTIFTALSAISTLKVIAYPFLPFSAETLHRLLGMEGKVESGGWTVPLIEPGSPLPVPEPLFAKLDDGVVMEQTAKLGDITKSNS